MSLSDLQGHIEFISVIILFISETYLQTVVQNWNQEHNCKNEAIMKDRRKHGSFKSNLDACTEQMDSFLPTHQSLYCLSNYQSGG